jgi:uncharacterized protein (TIGR00255 family)
VIVAENKADIQFIRSKIPNFLNFEDFMIKSMTGYGRGQAAVEGLSFSVEIKSVNHRYGDVNIKAPRMLAAYEHDIKKQVSARLKRGKIDVYIAQENTSQLLAEPTVDERMLAAYLDAFKQMKQIGQLSGEVSLELLAGQKDVLILKETELSTEGLQQCVKDAVAAAIDAMLVMRAAEGEATEQDIRARLRLIEEHLDAIRMRAPQVPVEWQQKLKERLERLDENAGDPQRIAQEIAIFADRCDISEELSRFDSHLLQFNDLLQKDEPVGRQIDFLVQELNREANTMGSKSNDAELTRNVVALKAELEKIREQVQNIE